MFKFDPTPISFTITPNLIKALQSGNGGWSRDALAILGVPYPPKHGWKQRIIGKKVKVLQGSLDAALARAESFQK